MNRPNPAAVAMVSGRMRPAPCCSGDPVRAANSAERNVVLAPGNWRKTTADIAAVLIPEPVIKMRLTAGTPSGPGSRWITMTRNALPGGCPGMVVTVPATRTLIGPMSTGEVSCAVVPPRMASAAGEASTGTVPPSALPSLVTGTAGNGVLATRAA